LKNDIVFADPPYELPVEQFIKIHDLVFNNNLLFDNGLLIIEHSKQTKISHLANFLQSKSYGGNMFSFFKQTPK
jgi:16S rRNA G966 N2-methylase RsmD